MVVPVKALKSRTMRLNAVFFTFCSAILIPWSITSGNWLFCKGVQNRELSQLFFQCWWPYFLVMSVFFPLARKRWIIGYVFAAQIPYVFPHLNGAHVVMYALSGIWLWPLIFLAWYKVQRFIFCDSDNGN